MITYSNLTGLSISYLKNIFNEAFSDYTIPMQLDEKQIRAHLESNDFDPKLSIGCFDGDKMVGFVFVGHRDNRLYDAGTAVIKEYRRNGIAREMLEKIIAKMDKSDEFILECISTNSRALKLYESLGFKRKRHFVCFKLSNGGQLSKEVSLGSRSDITKSYNPSWQNEKVEANAIFFKHGDNILCVRPEGSVYFSDPDLVLINHALKQIGKLSFTNIVSNSELAGLLYKIDAAVLAEQEEMSYENN